MSSEWVGIAKWVIKGGSNCEEHGGENAAPTPSHHGTEPPLIFMLAEARRSRSGGVG